MEKCITSEKNKIPSTLMQGFIYRSKTYGTITKGYYISERKKPIFIRTLVDPLA